MGDERVVVAGGGVGGLGAALALARRGHQVLVLERDPLHDATSAEDAFGWERPGAPQTHQTHGFLARIVVLMRERFPDLLDALVRAGCSTMSGTAALGEPRPGDEDLSILLVRRTTFEWILRRAVQAEPGVEVRSGAGVAGLITGRGGRGRLAGRRRRACWRTAPSYARTWSSRPPGVGATCRPGSAPSGSACPRRSARAVSCTSPAGTGPPTRSPPRPAPKLGGDLGFLKYLIVPGDGGMLSATLAVRTDDRELRRSLSDPDRFERACRSFPGPDQWFGELDLEPVGGVRPMGGLMNRLRRFTDAEGHPTRAQLPRGGGRAHLYQSPLRTGLLAGPAPGGAPGRRHRGPRRPDGRAAAYEAACRDQVAPWWHHAVEIDRSGADPATATHPTRARPTGSGAVMAASQTDPVIGRGMARLWNLLTTPGRAERRPRVHGQGRGDHGRPRRLPGPGPTGPSRQLLLERLAA